MYTLDVHQGTITVNYRVGFPMGPRGFSDLLGGNKKAHPPINMVDGPFRFKSGGAYCQYGLSASAPRLPVASSTD